MKKKLLLLTISALTGMANSATAQTVTEVDSCRKNTSSSYVTLNQAFNIASTNTLRVYTSRYTDFNSTVSGKGALEIYSGGERTFIGTHDNKNIPAWTFTGKVDVYPHKAVESSCGFYGVIFPTRGKAFSPEDTSPTLNTTMAKSKVTLHSGAALSTEKSAAGVRIGELNTEAGSRMYGYYKSQSSATTAYYLVGSLNTDATLAGRIAPIEKNGTPDITQAVGVIKEGKGTYRITANDNVISCGVRVNAGTLLINNDAATAKSKKMTGGTGANATAASPVASAYGTGVLGGTGNIGGHVDIYSKLTPGDNSEGTLTLANYATSAACNLTVHPAAAINFSITDAAHYTSLNISGKIVRNNMTEGFSESSTPSQIIVTLAEGQEVKVGDSYTLVTANKGRENATAWTFKVVVPEKLTWKVDESDEGGKYTLTLTCTSLDDGDNDGDNDDDNDDGDDELWSDDVDISGVSLSKTLYLRQYLDRVNSDKRIGVAISNWRYNVTNNPSSTLSGLISNNFNLCVAEDEMKVNAIEPGQNYFDFSQANALVSYAQNKKMDVRGHCLVWHNQCPEWISADGKKNDKNWTRAQLLEIMKNHITRTVQNFGGKVCEWDVVNETLDDDQTCVRTNPNSYQLRKQSIWVNVIGEDFIDSAFVYAHRANPNIKLYLNDYDCEFANTAKSTALFNLAKRLKNSGIPIDGVGLQCHLKTANEFSQKELNNTVKRFASIGMNCIFTEVDVTMAANTTEEKNKQAEIYKQIAEVFLHNENCPHMLVWGISDQYSWIENGNPLLYDASSSMKPAYKSVREALHDYACRQMVLTSIEETKTKDVNATEVARYNVSGIRIAVPTKGVNIVKMSDGTVKKVMEK
ncbi:MAG: endo-1,4-beta-xylanase [Bacteroidales bacterium]|nr:endo-1,4-beta-xylanase [Bacteroidales bacterium]